MRLSESIRDIFDHASEAPITFQAMLDRVSHKSFGIFLVILSLPSALPVPAPGYSIPFGIALFFLGFGMVRAREYPWFPQRLLQRQIHTKGQSRLVDWMVWFLSIMETIIRRRLSFVYSQAPFYRALGLVVVCCAISMCIPIPLTNTGPALGVFLIGLGTLEEDGLAGMAGVFVAFCGLLLTATILVLIAFFGIEAVDWVKDAIKGFLGAPVEMVQK